MKLDQTKAEFQPVTITLETNDEVGMLVSILACSTPMDWTQPLFQQLKEKLKFVQRV